MVSGAAALALALELVMGLGKATELVRGSEMPNPWVKEMGKVPARLR